MNETINYYRQAAAAGAAYTRERELHRVRRNPNVKIVAQIEDAIFIEPTSRLGAVCHRCQHHGQRVDFMIPRKGYPGLFDDECPKCHTDEVEIFDPRYVK